MEMDPATLDRRQRYLLQISTIIPRPIAFVTSLSETGVVNLAPFSYFNAVSSSPPIAMINVGSTKRGRKDTWRNIETTRDFVIHVVTPDLMDAVIVGAREYPPDVSELKQAGLTALPSVRVRTPRVKESPVAMECALEKIVEVDGNAVILGRILLYHIDERVMTDGVVDAKKLTFVGRLGADMYCRVNP
jgi:flavin reductase (DIM6/NTAB) family NADH-FMN oxidoreductase RutF